jgi:hypothetical protein
MDTSAITALIEKAMDDGKTVTIKADEIKIDGGTQITTASGLEITVE